MTILVTDCPRCRAAEMTFDVRACHQISSLNEFYYTFENFCVCRNCEKSTTFVMEIFSPNGRRLLFDDIQRIPSLSGDHYKIVGRVSLKDDTAVKVPEYCPSDVSIAFNEGAICLAVGCWNAAGTMFRKCVDLASKAKLPPPLEGEKDSLAHQRGNLKARLSWLLEKNLLTTGIHDLSDCIREDGNDGAHSDYAALSKSEAEDLLEFTVAILERLYTEPGKIEAAKAKRVERRAAEH